MSEKYKRKPNTECSVCLKKIYRRPNQLISSIRGRFCSALCYGISQRKEVPCVVCKTPILSGLNRKTCSRKCANILRTGISYKRGSPFDKALSQKTIKLHLLEKRGAYCERCGYGVAEVLQLHHKNRDRKNNTEENLEILCPNCHFGEHVLKR